MAELNEQQIMANAQDILAGEKPIMFDKDIRPLIDLINMKIYTALRGAKEGKMAREDEMAAAEGEAPIEPTAEPMPGAGPEGELPEDMMDMTPLIEVLGPEATEDQAMAVYDAAQEMAETRGKSITDLAAMIKADFQLRMRLLELAAATEEAALPPMAAGPEGAPMGPPAGAPMGGPPMGGPPGGMPPEGMM